MFANDTATDPETEPRSFFRLGRIERLEYLRSITGSDARTVVSYQHSKTGSSAIVPIPRLMHRENQAAIVSHGFDCVQQQVRENLANLSRKNAHFRTGLVLANHIDPIGNKVMLQH